MRRGWGLGARGPRSKVLRGCAARCLVLTLQSAAWLMVLIHPAQAQTIPGDYEVGFGIRRVGAMSLGAVDANETGAGGGSFRLFATETQLDPANAFEGRLGIYLSETLRLEASGSYGVSNLRTRISSDVEGIPDVTAREPIQQYTVEGALLMDLPQWRLGTRILPFVAAGGGYLRHLHENKMLVEDGGLWHIGGGANLVLRSRPDALIKALGIRLDGRALFRIGGVAFDNRSRTSVAVGVTTFARF